MSIDIRNIDGYCPMQAEGTIDGEPFYFRARGQRWTMGIGGDPLGQPEWYYEELWGDGPFEAGYMPEDVAREIINRCAVMYRTGESKLRGALAGSEI